MLTFEDIDEIRFLNRSFQIEAIFRVIKHLAAYCRCRFGRFGAMSGKKRVSPSPTQVSTKRKEVFTEWLVFLDGADSLSAPPQ